MSIFLWDDSAYNETVFRYVSTKQQNYSKCIFSFELRVDNYFINFSKKHEKYERNLKIWNEPMSNITLNRCYSWLY